MIKAAGIPGRWSPASCGTLNRYGVSGGSGHSGSIHTFVSLMSDSGVPVEEIARLGGHATTRSTELVYRQ